MTLAELVPDPRGRDALEPVCRKAIIASTPAGVDEEVFVRLPNVDGGLHLHGPCPWAPRIVSAVEFGIPSEGDRALVAFDEEGEPWVVDWWPYQS